MSLGDLIAGIFGAGIDAKRPLLASQPMVLEQFFVGPIKAWGVIQDRRGNVTHRFEADMIGQWNQNNGTLTEDFVYYDSDLRQQRVWEITKISDTDYQARAGDIIGTAQGRAYGNAMCWRYEMDVPVDDTCYRLRFDDWMWAMDDRVVINRSYMKKFGITVAELTVFMQKQS